MASTLTFAPLADAAFPHPAAARRVLASLPRDGIFLRRGTLLLETSYPYGASFYATAWQWSRADLPLLFELAAATRLLLIHDETIVVCGDSFDPATVVDYVAAGAVHHAAAPAELENIILPSNQRHTSYLTCVKLPAAAHPSSSIL